MRPGQSRPLFHFNPLRSSAQPDHEQLPTIRLDGERLDPSDSADVRRVRPLPTAESAFEIQRELAAGETHTLLARWSVPGVGSPADPGWFYTNFDDTVGPRTETETFWPTVSSPEEFARHRIRMRVHADRPYTVVGSGVVRRREATGVQAWVLDTRPRGGQPYGPGRRGASDEVRSWRFDAAGVPVRLVSDRSPRIMARARRVTHRR